MRANRYLLLLIAGVALVAAFIDGYAYVFRLASHQSLTGPINQIPYLAVPALGFNQQIYIHKGLDLQGGTHLELQITNVRNNMPISNARDAAISILERRVNASSRGSSSAMLQRCLGRNRPTT